GLDRLRVKEDVDKTYHGRSSWVLVDSSPIPDSEPGGVVRSTIRQVRHHTGGRSWKTVVERLGMKDNATAG
ncbi:hypothetical protein NPIL_31191, partial [Nephila pilipes]